MYPITKEQETTNKIPTNCIVTSDPIRSEYAAKLAEEGYIFTQNWIKRVSKKGNEVPDSVAVNIFTNFVNASLYYDASLLKNEK